MSLLHQHSIEFCLVPGVNTFHRKAGTGSVKRQHLKRGFCVCGGPGAHPISTKELPLLCVSMRVRAWEGACLLAEVTYSEAEPNLVTCLHQLVWPEKGKVEQVSLHMGCHTLQGRAASPHCD